MKRFVVPPEWPPPERGWAPTQDWRPHPSWPQPPTDHRFWVNDSGKPVVGPIGYYGGPSKRAILSWSGAATVFVGVNVWALMMLGIAGDHQSDPQAEQKIGITSPTPTPKPSVSPTTRPPWSETSPGRAAPKPSRASAEKPARSQTRTPKPTKPTPRPSTPRPTTPPSPTPPPEELTRAYCQQRGWDPTWCPPPNWHFTPSPRWGM